MLKKGDNEEGKHDSRHMITKETIHLALKDRTLILFGLAIAGLAALIIFSCLLQIRPSDVQVPVRYSVYGVTNLYREQWFYLFSFVGMGLILLILHPLLILKLLQEKGRESAISFAVLTLLFGFIGLLLTLAVFRVVSVSL